MNKKRTSISSITPLIVESHPLNYTGYPFLTLIQYDGENFITIVDSAEEKSINAYLLERCRAEGLEIEGENALVSIAFNWYNEHRNHYPISLELSKLGLAGFYSKVYRTFPLEFVSRVIGPLPNYELFEVISIRRKRKTTVSMDKVKIRKLAVQQPG